MAHFRERESEEIKNLLEIECVTSRERDGKSLAKRWREGGGERERKRERVRERERARERKLEQEREPTGLLSDG